MAWSEKAIKVAVEVYDNHNPFLTRMDHGEALLAALDAAAAVDGDPVDVRTVTAYESGFAAGKNAAAVDGDAPLLSQDEIMRIWREHGGDQFGPHVEHVSMPMSNFFGFVTAIRSLKRG